MAKNKKPHVAKNPNEYVWALEKGYGNIPARPLVGPAFTNYIPVFQARIEKAKQAMKELWR